MNQTFRFLSVATMGLALSLTTTHAFAAKDAPPPNDAQIAHIVVTANTIDIDAGELAKKTSTNDEVKKFADLMITDHTAVNKAATELVTKLGVKPEDNDISKSLKKGADKNTKTLKAAKGAAFDKAYVDNEVTYHQAVLDTIDKVLVPNAKNAELKSTIEKVRPTIAAHLEHAKSMQAKMGK